MTPNSSNDSLMRIENEIDSLIIQYAVYVLFNRQCWSLSLSMSIIIISISITRLSSIAR